jgi:beta-galactosidase
MPKSFIEEAHRITHQEYPGDQCLTAGWQEGYDVLIEARQHNGCRGVEHRPCVVSEYGDWEYYAQNAGLEQGKWKDLQPAERSSRQLRGDGETRLLQQASNFQEAHNDNLRTRAIGDGIWVMFDYSRGYAPDLEASGVMDIFRLPKLGYWFFRSQRDPAEGRPGPMAFIASLWTPESPLAVRVFSNAEEVALSLNGTLVERRRPDTSRMTEKLKHPPFTFQLPRFEAGTLSAVAFIDGRAVARHEVRTPEAPTALSLRCDLAGKPLDPQAKDVVFCHADLVDSNGTVAAPATTAVHFGATGPVTLVGENPMPTEAGTATILLQSEGAKSASAVYALALIREGGQTRVLSAATCPQGGPVPAYSVHYTTDGTEPSSTSERYVQPFANASGTGSTKANAANATATKVRAALFIEGRRLVEVD